MRSIWTILFAAVMLSVFSPDSYAATLNHVQFPEQREVQLNFEPIKRIPGATMTAKVKFEDRQSWIELSYEKMKPAVLFGGDVTCYVLWTVSRDGSYENLGELWIQQDKDKDNAKFSTGIRGFALMVTAEPYQQVKKPSNMVITENARSTDPRAPSTPFEFTTFGDAPKTGFEDLSAVKYDSSNVLDVAQAQRAYDLANRLGAADLAPVLYRDAGIALQQAKQIQAGGVKKGAAEFARRSFALTNEAIKVSQQRIEDRRIEEQMNQRRAEIAAMEKRVAEAEAQAKLTGQQAEQSRQDAEAARKEAEQTRAQAKAQAEQAAQELAKTRNEMKAAAEEKQRIESEKNELSRVMEELRSERANLEKSMESLKEEKAALSGRLQEALSKVADTQQSARGTIVNLPDILFAVNEATLKPEASLVLAKLAGILLIMQDLNLRVEGHTDSTGTAAHNQKLSQQRADSVMDFLARQGIATGRMKAVGYGMDRPVADNNTAEGRQKNRRVEIVIAEGDVKEVSE
jgi:outer membrane protein OmpA-like peptidoglycan-associated protein